MKRQLTRNRAAPRPASADWPLACNNMVESHPMNAPIKIRFATLVAAVLLISPIGACSETLKGSSPPAHPCCPGKSAPVQTDCAKPGCIFMDTRVVPVGLTSEAGLSHAEPVCEGSLVAPLPTRAASVVPVVTPPPLHRFVILHQFLI